MSKNSVRPAVWPWMCLCVPRTDWARRNFPPNAREVTLVVMVQNGGRSAPTIKKATKDRENKLTSERGG